MKFNSVLNNFTSGEWSPKMLARTDTEQYPRAAKEITNGFVRPQGGVFRRPGFALRSKFTFNLTGDHIQIPFVYRGVRYMIFATSSNWYVVAVDSWTEVTLTRHISVTLPSNPLTIRHVQIGEMLIIVGGNSRPLVLRVNTSGPGLRLDPYDYYFSVLFKQPDSMWKSFPYGPIQADGSGGTITITGTLTAFGTVTLTSSIDLFYPEMVASAGATNMIIKVTSAGNTAAINITGYTDARNATGQMMSAKAGTSPLVVGSASGTAYEMAKWNGRDGWPTSVTAIQNRLVFGKDESLYFTRSGNYFDLMEIPFAQDPSFSTNPSNGARPFSAAPFSTGVTKILELTSAKTLVILTEDSEIIGYGGSNGISALPGGFIVESSTSFGSKRVDPCRVNSYVTFAQAVGSSIRDLTFNWESSQYKAQDISFPAEHLLRGENITKMVSTEMDGSHLWVLTSSGRLLHCSLDRDYSITAWSEVNIRGYSFRSIGVLKPSGSAVGDAFVCTVRETTTFATEIVRLAEFYEQPTYDALFGPYPEYMDLFQYKTAFSPSKTITGLSIFNGKKVQVISDGFYIGEYTVVSGEVTLPIECVSLALVGLPMDFVLETMPIESGGQVFRDVTGRTKRIDQLFIRFFNTLGAKYGSPQTGEFFEIPFRDDATPMDQPSPMKDMDITLNFPGNYVKVATVKITSDYPFPCNILGIGVKGLTNE